MYYSTNRRYEPVNVLPEGQLSEEGPFVGAVVAVPVVEVVVVVVVVAAFY